MQSQSNQPIAAVFRRICQSLNPQRRVRSILLTLAGVVCFTVVPARADFTETFSNGSDDGDWHLTSDPDRLLVIELKGGHPGAYLHGQVADPAPTWYVPLFTPHTHFVGDFAAQGIESVSCDIKIFSGIEVPDRAVTLLVQTTFGTGDFSQGVVAYYIGTDISKLPKAWKRYVFPLDADSSSVPPDWVVLRGDGSSGGDADWRALMHSVETIGFMLGKPGFAYPALNIWDLGLDNVTISNRDRGAP
jgi:hypothetical protein